MTKRKNSNQSLLRFVFLVYCAALLWLLFGRPQGWIDGLSYREMLQCSVNLTPLLTIRNYLHVIIHRTNDAILVHCIVNLAGNLLLFIPIGYLLPRIFVNLRKFLPFFVTCLGSIFLVEVLQLFTLLGSFDVDDIILNLGGMSVGYLMQLPKRSRK